MGDSQAKLMHFYFSRNICGNVEISGMWGKVVMGSSGKNCLCNYLQQDLTKNTI